MEKPSYLKNTEDTKLFNELRKKVNQRIENIPENRDIYIQIKAVVLPLVYIGLYAFAVLNAEKPGLYIAGFILMGITLVLIYLNLIHEAAHNNIFKSKRLNNLVLHIFDFVGANSYIWKKRHIASHHAYPNVDGWDTDIEQSGLLLIIPWIKAKGIQKYQHLFFFLVYPLYLFNWMFIRDFRDFFDKERVILKTQGAIPTIEKMKMIAFKLFYFFYQIAVPVIFFNVSVGLALGAWILQVITASIFALFVLLPLHPLPDNAFPKLDEKNRLPFSWLNHQFEVTNDLKENNWFVRNILGNFNFHVAHHLFPNYSYLYYNEITEEIEEFAKEHNLAYKRFPIFTALGKHVDLLRQNANNAYYILEE
ncbi:linoleoyl-CoA desaturase [Chryseobacterium ginsenosidimutans]|uniref:fatty acid desaturase family protein n=1 Tax=Chryseobacterium ginsenosidimutans TaxID=687846 RepID=UPI0027839634|nr:fatty acid desaturase [Chryseobacterium ginsenosidimutans]MDQ0591760.1 linoleoyl-CoA desaturase [Chryseobacterium ginsenosidimutans]